MDLLLYIVLAVVGTAVVWKGSVWLESSSERLATYYELPPIVQGAVIMAMGSSFPELSSTVIATLVHGDFDLGVSVIVGSAIFNISIIPGVAGLVGGSLTTNRNLVYKDVQFYITSIAVLLLAFAFAVIYNPVEGQPMVGEMDRIIGVVPVLVYGLYLFLHHQDTIEHVAEPPEEEISAARQWVLLGLGLVVIVVGVEGLVRSAIGLGDYFNTPSFLWGVTVIAAATSLPDAFVSIKAAQRGEGTVSIANVLGSNIFDLLVAVPVGVLIAGTSMIDFAVAAPMMGYLTFTTIVLFAILRTSLVLLRLEAWLMLGLYIVFVGWMSLETIGITSVVTG